MSDEIDDGHVLRQALEQLETGVWVGCVRGGETVHMNARFGELLNVSREDASRPKLLHRGGEPIAADDLPFARARALRASVLFEDVGVRASHGAQSHLQVRARPLCDAAGTVTHIMVTALDITEGLRPVGEGTTMQDRLALAVRHAPVAFWSVDARGIVTMSEGAILARFGLRPAELVGRSLFDVYRDHPTIPQDIRRALEGATVTYITEVGDVLLETWLAPIRTASGELAGAIGVSTDITERVRMQGELIQTDRGLALGTLAASVAHEINNPLTYTLLSMKQVRAAVARLGRAASDEERAACVDQIMPALDVIQDGLGSIRTVTRDLGSFARADDVACAVDVRAVAQSALRLVAKELEAHVRVVVDLQETPPILASEARLIQVFVNLLLNAAHALAGQAGERVVTLSTRFLGSRVVVVVADNGPGVPPSMRERIFEPFVTTKPIGLGTGLGLFVCRSIARGLGGDITVHDQPGGGAAFHVLLPAAEDVVAVAPVPAPPDGLGRQSARILVVDDDALVGAALRDALRYVGYSVTLVSDTAEAIRLLVAEPPFDLCFCDLMLHGVASMDVFETVAAQTPGRERAIVYMSGGAFSAEGRRFLKERGDRIVEKPFDVVREAMRWLAQRGA